MSAPPLLVAALARIFAGAPAARVVAEVLRAERGWNQAARGTAARRLFATALLRARLDFRARLDDRGGFSLGEGASPSEWSSLSEQSLLGEGPSSSERSSLSERCSLGGPRACGAPSSAASADPGLRAAALRLAAYLCDEEGADDATVRTLAGLASEELAGLRARLAAPLPWPLAAAERLAVERSLPRWLAELWVDELGAAAADALAAQTNLPGPLTVRANLRVVRGRDALAAELAAEGVVSSPARFSPWALHLWGRVNVFGSPAWRRGAFEVQDEGSQLVALAASPRPGERVVDYCAGAGGKTLALAMGEGGAVCACDIDPQRLRDLRVRLARAGVAAQELLLPAQRPTQLSLAERLSPVAAPVALELAGWSRAADVVLVDAPCSSLGTLRRGPDVRWRMDAASLQGFAALQRQLLAEAAMLVRPGGRLVYATCTLRRAENEEVAQSFTAKARPLGFAPLAVAALLGEELATRLGAAQTLTLRPDLHGTDGFFLAAWQRAR